MKLGLAFDLAEDLEIRPDCHDAWNSEIGLEVFQTCIDVQLEPQVQKGRQAYQRALLVRS
jgi:hypothetical protein